MRISSLMRRAMMLAVLSLTVSSFATTSVQLFKPTSDGPRAQLFESAHFVKIDSVVASRLQAERLPVDIEIPLSVDRTVTLHLKPYAVFDASTKWILMTKDGPVNLPPPDIATYNGVVDGDAKSRVYLGIDHSGITGNVFTGGRSYAIDPVKGDSKSSALCMIYAVAMRPPELVKITCATSDISPSPSGVAATPRPFVALNPNHEVLAGALYRVDIAVDCDNELFNKLGSSGCQTYATNIIGTSSAQIYEPEVNTQIALNYFHVWESGSPYNQVPLYSALKEFTDYWNANMQSETRGLTALLSGKNSCGGSGAICGLAELGGLCQSQLAYSCNQISGNVNYDLGVVAHEIGHNFGARHTHSCWWVAQGIAPAQIDMCAAAEDGTCFGGITPSFGTLMSYCYQKDNVFGDVVGPWVKKNVASIASGAFNCFVPANKLAATDTVIDFGVLAPGTQLDTTLISVLANVGVQAVNVISITIIGADAAQFSIVSGGGAFSLTKGQKHTLVLRFAPNSLGEHDAYLSIASSSPDSPILIHLKGKGGVPGLQLVTDTGIDSLAWSTDDDGVSKEIKFTNSGGSDLHVLTATIIGPDASMFQIVGNPAPFTVTAGSMMFMSISFSSTRAGLHHAQLVITTAMPSRDTIELIGNTVAMVLTTDSHTDSLTWTTKNQNYQRRVYIKNTGYFGINVDSTYIYGKDAAAFRLIGTMVAPFTIEADSTVALTIKFASSLPGPLHASLVIRTTRPSADTIKLIGNLPAPVTAVREGVPLSSELLLEQNYPNPVNGDGVDPHATIGFSLPARALTTLCVVDMYGRIVEQLVNEPTEAGRYSATLDAHRFAAGTYLLRLRSGILTTSKLMQIVR